MSELKNFKFLKKAAEDTDTEFMLNYIKFIAKYAPSAELRSYWSIINIWIKHEINMRDIREMDMHLGLKLSKIFNTKGRYNVR